MKMDLALTMVDVPLDQIKTEWNFEKQFQNWQSVKVSEVGDCSRGWPEGSLFDSFYTKV